MRSDAQDRPGFVARHRRELVASAAIHVALLVLLAGGFRIFKTPTAKPQSAPIQAIAVDQKVVEKELAKLNEAQARREAQQVKQQREIAQAEAKLAETQRQRKVEERKAAQIKEQLKVQQLAQQRQAEAEKAARAKARETEKVAAAELAKKEAERKAVAEKAAKLKAEQDRKTAEARRRAEQEKQRQADVEQQRRAELDVALAAEQEQLDDDILSRYTNLIREQVSSNWSRPLDWPQGRECEVEVQLIPSGQVVATRVTRSCGSVVFDRSVELAVEKASPLPVPEDPRIFDRHFRRFTFVFKDQ